jgi:hypothetical protein
VIGASAIGELPVGSDSVYITPPVAGSGLQQVSSNGAMQVAAKVTSLLQQKALSGSTPTIQLLIASRFLQSSKSNLAFTQNARLSNSSYQFAKSTGYPYLASVLDANLIQKQVESTHLLTNLSLSGGEKQNSRSGSYFAVNLALDSQLFQRQVEFTHLLTNLSLSGGEKQNSRSGSYFVFNSDLSVYPRQINRATNSFILDSKLSGSSKQSAFNVGTLEYQLLLSLQERIKTAETSYITLNTHLLVNEQQKIKELIDISSQVLVTTRNRQSALNSATILISANIKLNEYQRSLVYSTLDPSFLLGASKVLAIATSRFNIQLPMYGASKVYSKYLEKSTYLGQRSISNSDIEIAAKLLAESFQFIEGSNLLSLKGQLDASLVQRALLYGGLSLNNPLVFNQRQHSIIRYQVEVPANLKLASLQLTRGSNSVDIQGLLIGHLIQEALNNTNVSLDSYLKFNQNQKSTSSYILAVPDGLNARFLQKAINTAILQAQPPVPTNGSLSFNKRQLLILDIGYGVANDNTVRSIRKERFGLTSVNGVPLLQKFVVSSNGQQTINTEDLNVGTIIQSSLPIQLWVTMFGGSRYDLGLNTVFIVTSQIEQIEFTNLNIDDAVVTCISV